MGCARVYKPPGTMGRSHGAFFMAIAVLAFGLAACGGGGGGYTPPPPVNNPTPTPTPAPTGGSVGTIVPAGGGVLNIPLFAGFSGTVNVPAASAGAGSTVTITDQTTTPSGLLALTTVARAPLSNTPVLYFSITPSANLSFPSTPGFTITLPAAAVVGQSYFLANWNGASWVLPGNGPATVSGNVLTFAPINVPVTLSANVTSWFALYFTATATPTPEPTTAWPTSRAPPTS